MIPSTILPQTIALEKKLEIVRHNCAMKLLWRSSTKQIGAGPSEDRLEALIQSWITNKLIELVENEKGSFELWALVRDSATQELVPRPQSVQKEPFRTTNKSFPTGLTGDHRKKPYGLFNLQSGIFFFFSQKEIRVICGVRYTPLWRLCKKRATVVLIHAYTRTPHIFGFGGKTGEDFTFPHLQKSKLKKKATTFRKGGIFPPKQLRSAFEMVGFDCFLSSFIFLVRILSAGVNLLNILLIYSRLVVG